MNELLENLNNKLKSLYNTRKYKRKTDEIDKEIESIKEEIEIKTKLINKVNENIVPDIKESEIIDTIIEEQLDEIKEIVKTNEVKRGRKKKEDLEPKWSM